MHELNSERRWSRLCLVLAALPAAVIPCHAAEEAWQAGAKELAKGTLFSLTLRVATEKPLPKRPLPARGHFNIEKHAALNLLGPKAAFDGGHGKTAWRPLTLGDIALSGAGAPKEVAYSGDWSGARAEASFKGGKLTVYASRLSPGIAVETSTDRLVLFGGVQYVGMEMSAGRPRFYRVPPRKVTPKYAAVPGGAEMRVSTTSGAIPAPPADRAWMLLWWGRSSHFLRGDSPLNANPGGSFGGGGGPLGDTYLGDCPLLVAFSRPPASISVAEEGGLEFTFETAGARAVILPILGAAPIRAEETETWGVAVPADVVKRCKALASYAGQYPISARQSFAYDGVKDEATFTQKVAFLEIGKGGKKLAPMPPMAALAMQQGFPVELSGRPVELGVNTEFGPIVGIAESDTCAWSVRGLGKYVKASPAAGSGKVPVPLAAELEAEVGEMLRDRKAIT